MARKRRRKRKSRQARPEPATAQLAVVRPQTTAPAPQPGPLRGGAGRGAAGIGGGVARRAPGRIGGGIQRGVQGGLQRAADPGRFIGGRKTLAPAVAGAIASGVGGILESAGQGADQVQGRTEEQVQEAQDILRRGRRGTQGIAGAGSEVAGTRTTGPTRRTGKEVKREGVPQALAAFFEEQGMDPEEAQRRANRIAAPGGKKVAKVKGFKRFLRERGGDFGLRVSGRGKIKGIAQDVPGRVEESEASRGIREGIQGITGETIGGILGEGLPGQFAGEAAEGLGFRGDIRDALRQQLLGAGPEGLTQQDLADLQATEAAGLQRIQDIQRQNLQQVTGQLQGAGFASSSLAKGALQQGVFDQQNRLLAQLQGQQATQRQNILNAKANRRAAQTRALLGAAQGLGGPGSIGGLLQGIVSPGQAGEFTTTGAAGFGQRQIEQAQGLRQRQAEAEAQTAALPTLQETGGGGLLGGLL